MKKRNNGNKSLLREEAAGIGLGSILAVVVSWTTHHSIAWAIVHGCFGWLYIVYFALTQNN